MAMEDDHPDEGALESREPTAQDLAQLCARLNELEAKYIVIGGLAIRAAGYVRATMDVDLIIATDETNEAKVYEALRSLPDRAVDALDPGDVAKYTVVRVGDEIVVDLMKSAGGIDYAEASKDAVVRQVGEVAIPFASPRLLWRMKKVTHREKDAADLLFLKRWFEVHGEVPPE